MINVFEGLVRQDVVDGKGGFEKILSQIEQTAGKPDDSKSFVNRDCDGELEVVPFESQVLLAHHALPAFERGPVTPKMPGLENLSPLVVKDVSRQPSSELLDYPKIRLNKVTWQSIVPEVPQANKDRFQGRVVKGESTISKVSTTDIGVTVNSFRDNTYMQSPLMPPASKKLSDVREHRVDKTISGGKLGSKSDNQDHSTALLDTKAQNKIGMEFRHHSLVINGGVVSALVPQKQDEPFGKHGSVKDNNFAPSVSEGTVTTNSVSSVSPVIKPMPILGMAFPNYHLAPELFWQYPKLNSYVVLYRNKYYLFEFNEHKIVNYLEYSDDRN
ncbi:hypothetical protein [Vibrio aquimaris]|uniref:Uncharacterized protein n=1 Tax=Vibrio aquimaris TaxID=2587862 RepID=A0A5P9CPJ8_9VIBR|nr:hypothetical protein [Vibrio aquimaris]QFT28179.1 hypothetical protein FIV01_17450 [Vibrio aquimaris]